MNYSTKNYRSFFVITVLLFIFSLQGMENKELEKELKNEHFKTVQDLYKNVLTTYSKHIPEIPKELLESTQNWAQKNQEFIKDITNPENCIEKYPNSDFYKRKKGYDTTYNNKSNSNFVIPTTNNTWNYRLAGMVHYAYQIEPKLDERTIYPYTVENYLHKKTLYGFYQNSYCYVNSLIAKHVIKEHNLTKFKPVESHLVHIPGTPNYFSDRCTILVEENIPDSKPLSHNDVLNDMTENEVDHLCRSIKYLGAFDLDPNAHDNIRKDSEGFYRWVDMEPHMFTQITTLLSNPEDRPIFPFLHGLNELLELFEQKDLPSFSEIVVKNAKNWIHESEENIQSYKNNFNETSLSNYLQVTSDERPSKKQKLE